VLATVRAVDIIGEMALLTGSRRSATAVAKGPAAAYRIPGDAFRSLMARCPAFSRDIARRLANRLNEADFHLVGSPPPADVDGLRACLASVRSFRGLSAAAAEALAAGSTWQFVQKWETLFEQNAPGDTAYLVLEGRLSLVHTTPSGRKRELAQAVPGRLLGEMSLLDGAPRYARAVARHESHLLAVPRTLFCDLVENDASFATCVLANLGCAIRTTAADLADFLAPLSEKRVTWKETDRLFRDRSFGVLRRDAVESFVRSVPPFCEVRDAALLTRATDSMAQMQHGVSQGSIALREDHEDRRVLSVVYSGSFAGTRRETRYGTFAVRVLDFAPGATFGEEALLTDGGTPPLTVGADQPGLLLDIPADVFAELLQDAGFRNGLLRILAQRLRKLDDRFEPAT
jgi:CRP-like cAMP-binding protein